MSGNYTPLLLSVGDGIIKNKIFGLSYTFQQVKDDLKSKLELIQSGIGSISTTEEIAASLENLLDDIGLSSNKSQLITDVEDWTNMLLGDGDNSRFAFHFQTLCNHIDVMNAAINSTVNSTDIAKSTFTSMNNLLTGNISLVCSDPRTFGEDLENTGQLFDFVDIESFGSPFWLLKRLSETNALEFIYNDMKSGFITPAPSIDVNGILNKSKPTYGEQHLLHTFFTNITGATLKNILVILQVTTQNINFLSDLYSLPKLFPTCWKQLNCALYGNVSRIFEENKSVSSNVVSYIRLTAQDYRLPNEHSKANRAFAYAMLQIKNITATTPTTLSEYAKNLELVTGMNAIENAETPMNTTIRQDLANMLSPYYGDCGRLGSGPNNNLTLMDAMGSLIGGGHMDVFNAHLSLLNAIDVDELIATITTGVRAIEAGTSNIAKLTHDVELLLETNYVELQTTSNNLNQSYCQVSREKQICQDAELYDVDDDVMLSRGSTKFAMIFASTLHSYATDEEKRTFLENVTIADPTGQTTELNETYYSQVLHAALKEGVNLQQLNTMGVVTDTIIAN